MKNLSQILAFVAGLAFGALIAASLPSNAAEPHKAIVNDGERFVMWIDGKGFALPTEAEINNGDCGAYTFIQQYDGLPVCVID